MGQPKVLVTKLQRMDVVVADLVGPTKDDCPAVVTNVARYAGYVYYVPKFKLINPVSLAGAYAHAKQARLVLSLHQA